MTLNLYTDDSEFYEDEDEVDIDSDAYSIFCNQDTDEYNFQFLKVRNEYVRINCSYEKLISNKDDDNFSRYDEDVLFFINEIKHVVSNRFNMQYNLEKKTFKHYFISAIGNGNYYCYMRRNKINPDNEYDWKTEERSYIINPNEEFYYFIASLNKDDFLNTLELLYLNNSEINSFKHALKIFKYEIKNYIIDNNIKNEIIDFYSDVMVINKKYIEKFFDTIYSVKNFKSYFKCPYNLVGFYSDNLLYYVYDSNSNDSKDVLKYKRISIAITNYSLKNSLINPYTGELINKKIKNSEYDVYYQDHNHLIVREINSKFIYFIRYNDIFVETNLDNEIREINDAKETIDTLCE